MTPPPRHRWSRWDALVIFALAGLALLLAVHTGRSLNYQWDWATPLRYLANVEGGAWRGGLLAEGLLMSLRLMLVGGALALLLGVLCAVCALSPLPALRLLARLYVEGLRHLPPIVFMFVFFYLISSQLFGSDAWRGLLAMADNPLGRFLLGDAARAENLIGGVLCLAVFEAAFVAEIIRAGVRSIEAGQWQAARSLGLSSFAVWRFVILPQAVARIAAPLAGQLVLLVKDSAILSVISVQELSFSAQETAVSTQQIFETWLLAAALYACLCAPLLLLCKKLER